MATTMDVGNRLVELCKAGENRKAIEELYADDATSYEAMAGGPQPRELAGKPAILDASDWFFNAMEIHGGEIDGPYPCDDKFICFMSIDCTAKEGPTAGQRIQMKEACHYHVKDGKITRAEYYYPPMGEC